MRTISKQNSHEPVLHSRVLRPRLAIHVKPGDVDEENVCGDKTRPRGDGHLRWYTVSASVLASLTRRAEGTYVWHRGGQCGFSLQVQLKAHFLASSEVTSSVVRHPVYGLFVPVELKWKWACHGQDTKDLSRMPETSYGAPKHTYVVDSHGHTREEEDEGRERPVPRQRECAQTGED